MRVGVVMKNVVALSFACEEEKGENPKRFFVLLKIASLNNIGRRQRSRTKWKPKHLNLVEEKADWLTDARKNCIDDVIQSSCFVTSRRESKSRWMSPALYILSRKKGKHGIILIPMLYNVSLLPLVTIREWSLFLKSFFETKTTNMESRTKTAKDAFVLYRCTFRLQTPFFGGNPTHSDLYRVLMQIFSMRKKQWNGRRKKTPLWTIESNLRNGTANAQLWETHTSKEKNNETGHVVFGFCQFYSLTECSYVSGMSSNSLLRTSIPMRKRKVSNGFQCFTGRSPSPES